MKHLGQKIFTCTLLLSLFAYSQDSFVLRTEKRGTVSSDSVAPFRFINHSAFGVGERLVFDVGYSIFTAGEAVMTIPKTDTLFGRECYQVLFTVNSTPSFSWIYKVEDRYETMLDVKGVFPWRFTQRIREGKYSYDFGAVFDQMQNIATTDKGKYSIPLYVHDVVSAFYYARTLDFTNSRVGEKTYLYNFYKDTTHTLAIKFLGRQQIEVDAGTFNCVIVEPLIKEGGLFKSEGRVIVWMTDDERKIPVKVSTKVVIGSIEAELREYSGINGPIKAKVK
ncbi:MAG: DUF3108 domain-containing protein [Ignavibacteriales bacterium]|nr:DUF3108 domain-containing protein [Ignavibacteriales bacterium]